MPLKSFCALGMMVALPCAAATPLKELADSLGPGDYGLLETGLTLEQVTEGNITVLNWSDSAGWDAKNRRMHIVCKRASAFNHRYLTYDEQSNSWSMDLDNDNQFGTHGHCYDGNTTDPETGIHYFLPFGSTTVRYRSDDQWLRLPEFPMGKTAAMSLSWVTDSVEGPGLLAVSGSDAGASWYNPDSGEWRDLKETSNYPINETRWGSYHVFSQYNPIHNLTLLGGGNGAGEVIYSLDEHFDFQLLSPAPFDLRMSDSLVSVAPGSGLFLVYDGENRRWWHFDVTEDKWGAVAADDSPPSFNLDTGAVQVPVHDYGIVLFVTITNGEPSVYAHRPLGSTPDPEPQGIAGDQNSDGTADLLWRNNSTGDNYFYLLEQGKLARGAKLNTVSLPWQPLSRGDFNGDGMADIFWRNSNTGDNYLYLMQEATVQSGHPLNKVSLNWKMAGSGDFNGDSYQDLLWRHGDTGQIWQYQMDGARIAAGGQVATVPDTHWQITATGDFNGDGNDDLLWHHQNTGALYRYTMDGIRLAQGDVLPAIGTDWQAISGDFDGNGTDDLLWRHRENGTNWLHLLSNGDLKASYPLNVVPVSWQIVDVGDFNGDGQEDLLWRHQSDGRNWVYLLRNGRIHISQAVNTVSNYQWQIVSDIASQ